MTPITVADVVAWWNNASTEDREEFLMGLDNNDAYPVSERTWYVHPVRDYDKTPKYTSKGKNEQGTN
jgi:hypothetical protein